MSRLRQHLFAIVVGLMDGILTALTLAAGKIVENGPPLGMSLALRISAGAALSGVCIYFVAEYARLRQELVHSEKHLNLLSHGRLAVSRLGRQALTEAAIGACLSCLCSFLGALFPLASAAFIPERRWLAVAIALFALALVGVCLARVIYASGWAWAVSLVITGIALGIVGVALHIV